MPRRLVLTALALGLGALAGACDPSPTATPDAPALATALSDDPTFVEAAPDAPAVANPVVQLWAVKGRDREAIMWYGRASGARDSVEFLSFRVKSKSLAFRPDGSAFANGDSVLITATLVDPVRRIVDFQPAGLRFSAKNPAVLKLSFEHSDDDLNGDGVVNAADTTLVRTFQIWRQESPLDPWLAVPTRVAREANEVEAEIVGFTGYAIAFRTPKE